MCIWSVMADASYVKTCFRTTVANLIFVTHVYLQVLAHPCLYLSTLMMPLWVLCIPSVCFHSACSGRPAHQFNLNYIPASHLPLKLSSTADILPPWWIAQGWMFSWAVNRSIRKGSTNGCAFLHWTKGWDWLFSPRVLLETYLHSKLKAYCTWNSWCEIIHLH